MIVQLYLVIFLIIINRLLFFTLFIIWVMMNLAYSLGLMQILLSVVSFCLLWIFVKILHSRILIHTGSIGNLQIVIFTICNYIFISVGLLFVLVCCLCYFLFVCAKEWTSHSEQPPVFLYFCSVISFITNIFNILSHASGYVHTV